MLVKVEMGEWVNVYHRFVGWVEMPDNEEITPENLEKAIDNKGVDFEKDEYDWTTEDHDEWDFDGFEILDIRKKDEKTN